MRKPCATCKHDHGRCAGKSRKGGHQYCWEPKTNGDRIRAMNDKKLAKWIDGMYCKCVWCDVKNPKCDDMECIECIEKWLKKPAEEEE